MGGDFSRLKTRSVGATIVGADDDAEIDNIIDNLIPAKLDDFSLNNAQMQSTVDPYAGSVESLATSSAGEFERLRYLIKQITGEAQWYIDPDATIAALNTAITSLIPSGTAMVFFQASAPTGWTGSDVNTDAGLRVVTDTSNDGGSTGGTLSFANATVASHTLIISEMPAHTHAGVVIDTITNDGTESSADPTLKATGSSDSTGGGGGHVHGLDLKYVNVIVATKD
jgi:hypothetical protein